MATGATAVPVFTDLTAAFQIQKYVDRFGAIRPVERAPGTHRTTTNATAERAGQVSGVVLEQVMILMSR